MKYPGSSPGGILPFIPKQFIKTQHFDNSFAFAMGQFDPFRVRGVMPHAYAPLSSSHCAVGFSRGTGVIGTNGVGYIYVTPRLENNNNAIYVTGSTYPNLLSGTFNISTDITNGYTFGYNMSDLPYSLSAFGAGGGLQGRICAAGARVRYAGKQINMAGTRYHIKNVDANQNLSGTGVTFAGMIGRRAGIRAFVNDRRWSHSTFKFYDDTAATLGSTDAELNGSEIIVITGTPGETFEWEQITFIECVGVQGSAIIASNMVPNHANKNLANEVIDEALGDSEFPEAIECIERVLRIYRRMVSGQGAGNPPFAVSSRDIASV